MLARFRSHASFMTAGTAAAPAWGVPEQLLTQRESEVLAMIWRGLKLAEAGKALEISAQTVATMSKRCTASWVSIRGQRRRWERYGENLRDAPAPGNAGPDRGADALIAAMAPVVGDHYRIVAYVMVAIFGAALAAALLIPAYGARFVRQGEAIVPVLNGQTFPALTDTTPVTIANRTTAITVPAATLVPDDMAPGTPAQIRKWYRDRSRIAEVARGEAATISFRLAARAMSAPLALRR